MESFSITFYVKIIIAIIGLYLLVSFYLKGDEKKKKSEQLLDRDYYLMTCSIVALFSWVIRRDGVVDEKEVRAARLFFVKHTELDAFLKRYSGYFYRKEKEDPVSGIARPHVETCIDLLNYYNQCDNLLHYDLCCEDICRVCYHSHLQSSYGYDFVVKLMKALFQVAFSSDGVIGSELKILLEISKSLRVPENKWNTMEQVYESYRTYKNEQRQQKRKKKRARNDSKRQEENSSEQQKQSDSKQQKQGEKSSSFGYKLTQAYNQLGLLTTASESEIKEAYRTLVKKYHPDRLSPDATDLDRKISADQFRLVKEAYDLIRLERGK